jgi:peroxiredoxin
MQSNPAVVREDLKDDPAPFHIICDEAQEIYKTLEIHPAESKEARMPKTQEQIDKMNAKREQVKASGFTHGKYEGDEMQLPAMFIVEADGTVSYAHYAENMIDMPTVDEVLEILSGLNK